MSKVLSFFSVFVLLVLLASCLKDPTSIDTNTAVARELTASEKKLVESDNKFGLKLFKQVIEEEGDKNVFISPLSVSMALGMTYNGANGQTKEAMQNTLEFSGMSVEEINEAYKSLIKLLLNLDPKVKMEIANSIWYRQEYTLAQEFVDLNQTYFNARVSGLDFGDPNSPNIINNWVEENTHGKIKGIIDQINPEDVMFLINALYFKGIWQYEFDEQLTRDDWFILPDSSKVNCRMMNQESEFPYFSNSQFQAIDLPYGAGKFSMTIFLPRPGRNLDSLIAEINQANWSQWMQSFQKQEGKIELPKFKLEYDVTMNQVLRAMGMEIALDRTRADFSKMVPEGTVLPGNLFISEVKHKTFVEVNEEGTEAAAATSVTIGVTSVGGSGFVMRVDRPFMFVIRENHSQTILFIGKIVEPKVG